MKEILRTNDLIKLSWARDLLAQQYIDSVVLDDHTAQYYGGTLIERRLMVLEDDYKAAIRT